MTQILRRHVAELGILPFDQFMELALYHLQFGYYERAGTQIGQRGDYYTSVSVGSLLGELLAVQFSQWQCTHNGPWQVLEAGAHDGQLAADILTAWDRPGLANATPPEYWILESSVRRRARQQQNLQRFAGRVRWFEDWKALPTTGVSGVIFANELLDSFPVRRLGWDAVHACWFEWGVGLDADRFVWAKMPLASEDSASHAAWTKQTCGHMFFCPTQESTHLDLGLLAPLSGELQGVLPDDFTTEICPAAAAWWQQAATALQQGHLLTLDYGLTAEEFFVPQRADGTLRAYRRHHPSSDVLAEPGNQDLTASVNFTVLQAVGERAGLKTAAALSQAQFLTPIARQSWERPELLGPWTAGRARQFHTLTHPEHLGRAFRVLIQRR